MADRSIPPEIASPQVKAGFEFLHPSGFARNVRLPIVSLVTCMGVSSNGED
jgi:hypothetical protein